MKTRTDQVKKSTGYCISCAQQKRPFEGLYNCLYNDHRKLKVDLTYDEFLEFTKINTCHYCKNDIKWNSYTRVKGKFISRSYFLDRKDNDIGYSKENCVVCCTRCNRARSNKFTYEEWYGMTEYFRNKK